jgi:2-C-methyl-D-erythritol 4-phosphate cytidylyltransferase
LPSGKIYFKSNKLLPLTENKKMDKYLIIAAAGRGVRMKSGQPKQFLRIGRYPIVYYCMKVFHEYDKNLKIIIVLPADMIPVWEDFISESGIIPPHSITEGGNSRMESTRHGLSLVAEDGLVAIHDAVRPLVSHETIDRCFKTALALGNAIPVCDIYESLRQIAPDGSVAINRNLIKSVQTPQVFQAKILKDAFLRAKSDSFTDEASVVESLGYKINLVEGNRENIKITDPFDLKIAGYLLDLQHPLS